MTWTRRLAPIALVACLLLAGCIGQGPPGLQVDAYETSTVTVSSWTNDADRSLTVRVEVLDGDRTVDDAERDLDGDATDGVDAELVCHPGTGGTRDPDAVTVTVLDPRDGSVVARSDPGAIDCRPWPTVWSVTVTAEERVEVERAA